MSDDLTRAIAEALADDAAMTEVEWGSTQKAAERITAALAPLIEARVREVEEERDRNKRAAVTLGKIVERQCRDVLDSTGMHHVIDDTGDGDWALVWERLAEIGAFIKAIGEPPNEVRNA